MASPETIIRRLTIVTEAIERLIETEQRSYKAEIYMIILNNAKTVQKKLEKPAPSTGGTDSTYMTAKEASQKLKTIYKDVDFVKFGRFPKKDSNRIFHIGGRPMCFAWTELFELNPHDLKFLLDH